MATAHHASDALEATARLRKSGSTSSLVLISLLVLWVAVAVAFLATPGNGGPESPHSHYSYSPPREKIFAPNNALSTACETPLPPQAPSRAGTSFASRYQQSKGQ